MEKRLLSLLTYIPKSKVVILKPKPISYPPTFFFDTGWWPSIFY